MELTQLTFAVDTTPLDTADKKIRGLGEALKTLERPMSAIAKDSSTVASGVEEIGKSTDDAAKGLDKVERNAIKLADTMRFYRGEIVEVNNEQVALGANFTKTQSAFLAYNKLIGATSDQLKRIAKEFMDLNTMTSANTFDNQIKGISVLTRQIEEHRKVQELAASGISLTKDQIVNLVRETNRLEQSMKSMGVSTEESTKYIQEQTNSYIAKAKELNSLIEISNRSEQQAKAEARANADALEQAKKLSDYRMQNWASSVGTPSTELSSMKDHYQKAEKEAADFYATMEAASKSYRSSFIANQEAEIKQMEKRKKMWQDLYGADHAAAIKEEEDAVKRLTMAENARMKNWAESVGMKSTELMEMSSHYSKQEQDAKSFYSAMQSASDSYRASFIANQEAEIKEMEKRKRMWKDLYGEDNAAAIRAEADAAKQLADTNAYTTSKMEQLRAQVSGLEKGLTIASSNALYQFEKNLKATGVAADVAEKQVAEFTALLKQKQDAPSTFKEMSKSIDHMSKQVNHLARDVSVQLGDIAISLAGGQNPFMVMIQQGDQIRGALMRAKDSGVDTSQAMKNALGQIATSFVDLGQMVGSFFVGSIQSAGNAVKRLVTEKTMLGKAIDYTNEKFGTQSETIARLGAAFTAVTGTALVGFIASLGAMAVAYAQVVSEQDKLVKTINLVGGSLGLTADQVNMMAQTYAGATGTVTEFTNAIVEIAKTNAIPEDMIQRVSSVAIELEKVADIPVEKTVAEFAKLGEKPTEAAIKLAEATGLIDAATLKSIASLERQGNVAEAAKLAIEGYAQGLSSATEIIRSEVSSWETISNSFFESFKRGWDAIKSLFRQAPLEMRMAEAKTLYEERLAAVDNPTGLKRLQTREARQEWADEAKERLDSIRNQLALERTLGDQRQYNSEQSEFVKNTEAAINATLSQRDKLLKQISIEQKKIEDGKIEEAAGLNLIKKLRKDIADIDEREAKKNKGQKPKETFSVNLTNEVEESRKAYDRQLKIAKDYESSRRDILKNSYEARMISLGDYVGQEIKLSIQARDNQLEIARQGNEEYNALMQKNRKAIEDAAQSAIDKGGSVSAIQEKEKKDLEDLDRRVKGVNEAYLAQVEALDAATDKRFSDFYKELAKSAIESEKSLTDFTATVQNNANARKEEIDLQLRLIGAHGAEAEAIKASSAAMKSYAPEIAKQTKLLADQEKVLRDLNEQMKDATPEEAERLDVLGMQALENTAKIRKNLDRTVAQQRQDSEQAATDASIKYQIEKYNELKGTLSDSIYTAIFEGGKQGGDVLKNYLMKEFKNFAIKVFIEPIVAGLLGGTGLASAGQAAVSGAVSLGGSLLSSAATSLLGKSIGASLFTGVNLGNMATAFGTAFKASVFGNSIATSSSVGSMVAGQTAGSSTAATMGAYTPYAIAAVAALNAFGVFRKTELKDTGIRGVVGDDSTLEGYKTYRKSGTLFSGPDWWKESTAIDPAIANALNAQYKQIEFVMTEVTKVFGAGADSIKNFSTSIDVSFKDLDAAGIEKKLTETFADIENALSRAVLVDLAKAADPAKYEEVFGNFSTTIKGVTYTSLDQINADLATWKQELESGISVFGTALSDSSKTWIYEAIQEAETFMSDKTSTLIKDYQQHGETFTGTLSRLTGSLLAVNGMFELLGQTAFESSLKGADAAYKYAEAFGGVEQFNTKFGNFYDKFFTESEKLDALTRQTTNAFKQAGIEMPKTREEFKKLVQSNIALGQASAETTNFLLTQADAIDTLYPAQAEAQKEVKKGLQNLVRGLGISADFVTTEFTPEVESAMQSIGLSAEGMTETVSGVLESILAGKTPAAEAGTALATAVIDSIYNAIIGSATASIAQAFTQSIIAPIIANIAAGQAALAGLDISGAVQVAVAQVEGLTQLFASPAFSGAMGELTNSLMSIGQAAGNAANQIGSAAVQINGAIGVIGGADPGYTPGLFAIGGSAVSTTYLPRELSPLSDTAALQQEILEANKSVAKLLEEYLKKDDPTATRYEKLAKQLAEKSTELKVPQYQQEIASLKATIADFTSVLDKANPLISAAMNGDQNSGQALTTLAEMIVQREGKGLDDGNLDGYTIPGFTSESMVSRVTTLLEDLFTGLGPREVPLDNLFAGVQTPTTTVVDFLDKFPGLVQSLLGITAAPETLQNDLNTRIKQLASLEKDLRDWYIAQARVIAIEDATSLAKETADAKARTAELKRTGGLEDPITKLKEQFHDKMRAIDEGIGAALQAEIDLLLGNKADTRALDKVLAQAKDKKATLTAPGYLENTLTLLRSKEVEWTQGLATLDAEIQQQLQNWTNSVGTAEEAYQMGLLNNMTSTSLSVQASLGAAQAEIARLTAGGLADDIAAVDKTIADIEENIKAAVLAATNPAKRAELQAEIDKYKGGIMEWYKAQQELLSTEMLVDINQQIKELETAEQGPITAIKSAIDKYIADFKALDQYTPEVKAQLDKLAGLQLGKARADLYNQLLPDEVVKQDALADLTKQFTDLGQKLPATTADFKTLIDSITDQNLKDKLLELIPAFISLQDAVESVATVTEVTVQDAYDKIKAVNKTAEDVANERISLEERLFNATATTAQAAEAARNAIHPLNLALYDSVIAAENAKVAAEERKGLEVELLQLLGNTTALRERELEALDASNRALQQQIWVLEDARDATDKALAALERATAEQIKTLEKTFTATDLAMQVLEKAVDKEKQRLQEQLQKAEDSSNALKKVFDTLEKAIKSLRGQVDQTSGMQVQEARAILSSALSSGIPSDATALEDAVGVLKADVEKGLYATSYDKSRAFLTLANDLEKLKQNSEPQLTTAEQQVKLAKDQIDYLDNLLIKAKEQINAVRDVDASLFGIDGSITDVEKAQSQLLSATQAEQEARKQINKLNEQLLEFKTQVEILRGIDNSIVDVETAVGNVKTAINTEMQAIANAVSMSARPVSSGGGGVAPVSPPVPAPAPATNPREDAIKSLYQSYLGRESDAPGLEWYVESNKTLEQIRDDFIFASLSGNAYADGGYYPGGLALVGEEGPELINFSNPGMVYTAAQSANLMQGDNSDLVAELQSLRQEVVMLRAEVRADVSHNAKTAKLLDRVIPDGQSIQVTPAA